jgi:hypothetical protein
VVSLKPAGSFEETGNFVAQGANHVDPQLLDILQTAAQMTGMQVQATSGYRPGDARFHGKGLATDVRIIGPDGQPLPNYQTPQTFSAYETLAQAARQVQQQKYPDLDKQFRWGGYFSGDKGKYGAMDLMHFDLGGSDKLGMAGGSWDKGLTSEQASYFPGVKSQGALAFAPQNPVSDSAGAVDAMATGGLKPTLVHTTNVPPPFSGQQSDFAPLIPEQSAQTQAAPQQPVNAPQAPLQGEPGPVQAAPISAPQQNTDDILKSFLPAGADTSPDATAARPQETPDDILNSFLPKEGDKQEPAPKPAVASSPAIGLNDAVRSVATGVPIIGGLLNKADAATNALIAPLVNPMLSDENKLAGASFGDRYNNSLNQLNGMDTDYAKQHPIANTVGNVVGGVAGTLPLIAAAPAAMGAGSGSLAGNMLAGAASGAAIGGTDSAIRSGGDLEATKQGAEFGGAFGAAGPVIGKAIGWTGNKLLNVLSGTSPEARNIANVLAEIGMTPQDAKAALAKMGPNATLADIDPALTAEAGGLAAQGGAPTSILKTAMAQRAAGADDRVAQAVETTLGARPDITATADAIKAQASADAGPHYQTAPTDALDPAPVLAAINKKLETANGSEKNILTKFKSYLSDPTTSDIGAQTQKVAGDNLNAITDHIATTGSTDSGLDSARAILVKAQSGAIDKDTALAALQHLQTSDPAAQKLISGAADALDKITPLKTDPQALLKVRQAMDDDIQKAPQSETTGGANAERAANGVRGELDKVLKTNGGIKAGDAAYSTQMRNADALQEGTEIFSPKTKIEDLRRSVTAKTPEQVNNMRTGALSSLWDALDNARHGDLTAIKSLLGKSTANRQKLEALFPNSSDVFDKISNEAAMRTTEQRVAQNSATAERQAVQQKYAPKPNGATGTAEALVGESLAGGPGAAVGYIGRNALNSLRAQISEGSRNALTEGTAKGLVATGSSQQAFLNQLERAAATAKGSSAITNAANVGSNLLFRAASDEARRRNSGNKLAVGN